MNESDLKTIVSRRGFFGAAASGLATLSLGAAGAFAGSSGATSKGSTVRDRLWIFTMTAGSSNHDLELGDVRGGSRMTPAESAFYLNVPNLILVRAQGLPPLPANQQGRTRTEFQQYATAFRPLQKVIWSVVGAGGKGGMEELSPVLSLANEFPNIGGVFLDDFIVDPKRQRDGRWVGRPALMPGELMAMRQSLKSVGRSMEIWVALNSDEVQPNHPHYTACEPPLADFLGLIDVLTLWTWNPLELRDLEKNFAGLEAIALENQQKALGITLWDCANHKPMPPDLMKYQCELGLKWLREKRLQHLVFFANTVLDVGLESAEFVRQWIADVGDHVI